MWSLIYPVKDRVTGYVSNQMKGSYKSSYTDRILNCDQIRYIKFNIKSAIIFVFSVLFHRTRVFCGTQTARTVSSTVLSLHPPKQCHIIHFRSGGTHTADSVTLTAQLQLTVRDYGVLGGSDIMQIPYICMSTHIQPASLTDTKLHHIHSGKTHTKLCHSTVQNRI